MGLDRAFLSMAQIPRRIRSLVPPSAAAGMGGASLDFLWEDDVLGGLELEWLVLLVHGVSMMMCGLSATSKDDCRLKDRRKSWEAS